MVFNVTLKIISVISWLSVLLMERPKEKHRPAASHQQTLAHNVVHISLSGIRIHISSDGHWLHRSIYM